ncbi:MAG: hypothetical protein WCO72_12075 [Betaproteobacteria bacterium]
MSYYLRYITIFKLMGGRNKEFELEPTSERILDEIALRELQNDPITVSYLMLLDNITSPATLHRKFSQMLKDEWVETRFENDNRRTKYIHLTKKAKSYYELKSKAMKKSLILT